MNTTRSATVTVLILLLALAGSARADLIADGTEFRANTYTTDAQQSQQARAVARAPGGSFVVVWDSYGQQSGGGYSVQGQRFDAAGAPVGAEFQANTNMGGYQIFPAVSTAADGGFVTVWSTYGQDGDYFGVFGQRYDSAGATAGTEFQANTFTPNGQGGHRGEVSVSAAADGSFVVVWQSQYGLDGDGDSIHAQSFDSAGAPDGTEFVVNTYTTGHQRHPAVSRAHDGSLVAVWESPGDGDGMGIRGQRMDATGTPIGSEFTINTYTTGYQEFPAVASAPDGSFLVVWNESTNSNADVRGRHYDATGTATTAADFVVNSSTSFFQGYPAVAAGSNGSFLVAWESDVADPGLGISARSVDNTGTPVGTDFQVNSYTTDNQDKPSIASDGGGRYVVIWTSRNQDGSNKGVYGQRLCQDADGDLACDVPEYVADPTPVPPGGTVTTDTEGGSGDGATPADPIETTITTSTASSAGPVSIQETVVSTNPPILEVTITAPPGTPTNPLKLEFRIDATMASSYTILKNGTAINLSCTGTPGTAVPNDPCISSTTTLVDGDVLVTVYTSTASVWRLEGPLVVAGCAAAPATGCVTGAKASFQVKIDSDETKEQLKWKLVRGGAFDFASLGDPSTDRTYRLCIYDETSGTPSLVGTVQIDPNTSWVAKDPKGYSYKDTTGAEDGVMKAKLKTGDAGKTSASVGAKGANIPMLTPYSETEVFHQDTELTVQLTNDQTAQCWSTTFTSSLKNDGEQYKAKTP